MTHGKTATPAPGDISPRVIHRHAAPSRLFPRIPSADIARAPKPSRFGALVIQIRHEFLQFGRFFLGDSGLHFPVIIGKKFRK